MTEIYNVYEAKTHLSQLLAEATEGKNVVIAKAGKPQWRIVPIKEKKIKRIPGKLKGKIWVAPDAFSREVDASIWADFYASDIIPPQKTK